MAWDDERRALAIKLYQEQEPTPANSMEVVAEVAESMGESVNGVRLILTKAGVYVKKEESSKTATTSDSKKAGSSTRVSKEDAQAKLIAALEAAGKDVDQDIISKLTGKAAVYFAGLFS